MIVSVLNQKGGSGKTTVSANLAYALKSKGFDVLLVDTDKQGSLRDWHNVGENKIDIVGIETPTLDKDLKKIVNKKDFIIIDGSPSVTQMCKNAIDISDFIVVPLQPSPLDFWATDELLDIIKDKKHCFLINRAIKNSAILSDVMNVLKESNQDVFETVIHQKLIYPTVMNSGKTVFDFGKKNKSAIEEMENFTNELLEKLEIKA